MPFLYDIVVHVIYYQHHIATVHKAYGKQHAHHEFIKGIKQENTAGNSSFFKKAIPADELLSGTFKFRPLESVFVKQLFHTGNIKLLWLPISGNFPPPKYPVV
jgi:hypothetical protein